MNAKLPTASAVRHALSKVPEVTLIFWIIKILCTTVGETAADLLQDKLGWSLVLTTEVMGTFLAVMLIVQFTARRYIPTVYWVCVVLLSIVGTLITDYFTDERGVELWKTTAVFSVVLAVVFASWYAVEKTLSIHSIYTPRREAFYWLAILFTFALGTAAGDLISSWIAEKYPTSAFLLATLLFAALIAAIVAGHTWLGLNATLAFWSAYILTRPLGASIGDLLGQHREDGGLGIGKLKISVVFLLAIAGLIGYLTRTRVDVIDVQEESLMAESSA